MTYEKAMEKINGLMRFGSKPGLQRITKLFESIGRPDKKLKFIHIAGTNGKGSVCAMLSSMLIKQGYKTGLYISPYITDFRERMQINGSMIEKQALADTVAKIYPCIERMNENGEIITEFEMITAVAMEWFAHNNCDYVVLETGLGGRLDATNIIDTPLCSVITSISLDHTAVLGDTLDKIAFEKAGIIKNGGKTVYLPQEPQVNKVIERTAQERSNTLYRADISQIKLLEETVSGMSVLYNEKEISMKLCGEHQLKNTAVALAAVTAIRDGGVVLDESSVIGGLETAFMPARTEYIKNGADIILDGAHNPDGMRALSRHIKNARPKGDITAVIGMLADKDVLSSLSQLKGIPSLVIATQPSNPRRMEAQELAETAKTVFENVTYITDPIKAVETAVIKAGSDNTVIICGSLYLASQVREKLLIPIRQD